MQELCYLYEVWEKLPIIPCKSQKPSDLSYISWGRSLLNGFYFTLISVYSLGRNDIAWVGDLPLEQLTLG